MFGIGRTRSNNGAFSNVPEKPQYLAHGSTWWSGTLRAFEKGCTSIRHVPNGMKLAVYVDLRAGDSVWCKTKYQDHAHEETRYVYRQTDRRPYRRLWYRVTGTVVHPNCYFNFED